MPEKETLRNLKNLDGSKVVVPKIPKPTTLFGLVLSASDALKTSAKAEAQEIKNLCKVK